MKISHHYNPNTSLTSKKTNFNYKIRYRSGYSLGVYYIDQVKLFNSTNNNLSFYMNFGVAKKTKFNVLGADGVLGLGRETHLLNYSPLYCLKNYNIIENEGFSIKYNSELKNAILFFGEEHEDFKLNNVGFCPLASKTFKEKNFWSCELFSLGIINDKINSSINLNLSVIFDTGTNAIVLPKYILFFLKNQLKIIDCTINSLSLEISNIICSNKKTLPDLVFEIGNYYLTLSSKYFISYNQSTFNNTEVYILNIFFEEGIEMGVIGLPFFYDFHTRFDSEHNIMKFFSNEKKIIESFSRKINKNNINLKLKILIIILSFIVLALFIINIYKFKFYCFTKKSGKIENIEIIFSDKIALLPES